MSETIETPPATSNPFGTKMRDAFAGAGSIELEGAETLADQPQYTESRGAYYGNASRFLRAELASVALDGIKRGFFSLTGRREGEPLNRFFVLRPDGSLKAAAETYRGVAGYLAETDVLVWFPGRCK